MKLKRGVASSFLKPQGCLARFGMSVAVPAEYLPLDLHSSRESTAVDVAHQLFFAVPVLRCMLHTQVHY